MSGGLRELLWSTGVVMAGSLVLIALEHRYPYDRGQKLFRRGFWLDFLQYGILQSLVLGWLINGLIRWIDAGSGLSRVTMIREWPLWLQVGFFLVLHDLYIYWFHRWMHNNGWLWRLHEAHHSCKEVDWVAGSRSHPLEIVINQTIEFAPMVLFASPEVPLIKGAISSLWGMWIHSNIDVKTGWLQYLINGPEMHRWHHAVEIGTPGANFSTKIAIWDWLFGTAYRPAHKPQAYGLGEVEYPEVGWIRQTLAAFRPWDVAAPAATPAARSSTQSDAPSELVG
jgi:sterol desaturase/sphingolipid hydroxylase (fatty acid hydroxylase superfamily)